MILPYGDKILIRPLEVETKSAGGIVLPGSVSEDDVLRGEVIAVGPGSRNTQGQRVQMDGLNYDYHELPEGVDELPEGAEMSEEILTYDIDERCYLAVGDQVGYYKIQGIPFKEGVVSLVVLQEKDILYVIRDDEEDGRDSDT